MRLHRLDHHNGVVDHRTDDKHQCKQRQHVQTEAYHIKEGKRADKADNDGNRRNDGGTETLKEYVDDKHNEDNGFDKRFHYILDRRVEKVLCTHQVDKFHTFRQRLGYFYHLFVNKFDDFVGIRAGSLCNHTGGSRFASNFTGDGVFQQSQFNSRHIFQAQHFSVVERTDNEIFVVLFVFITAAVFEHILERVFRFRAQCSGRRFNVLFGKNRGNVGGDKTVFCHFVRVEPDAHGVVGTEHVGFTDTRNTRQSGFDVDFHIVVEELLVERAVRAVDGNGFDVARLAFADGDTCFCHFRRQQSLSRSDTVLHVHHRHVRVRALAEIDGDAGRTRVCCRGNHVGHVFHTVDGFFQRYNHTFLYRFRVRTSIGG